MFHWDSLAELEDETAVGVVIADHRGDITRVNAEFEKQFGWTSAEAVGRPLTIIMPEAMREAHSVGFSRMMRTGQPRVLNQIIRLPALTKGGREFMAEHYIIGEKRGEWVFGAAIRETLPRFGIP